MKIALLSDFVDFYDHWFDLSYDTEIIYERFTTETHSRKEIFNMLETIGYRTPKHGTVLDLAADLWEEYEEILGKAYRNDLLKLYSVVVYEDERLHAGRGKQLLSLDYAVKNFPHHYASMYIEQGKRSVWSISYRYLKIGRHTFILRYRSKDSWMSNVGDVHIDLLDEGLEGYHTNVRLPLFAIDFVEDSMGHRYAVDFNYSPGISSTGVEDILDAKTVASLIKDAIEHHLSNPVNESGTVIMDCRIKGEKRVCGNWVLV